MDWKEFLKPTKSKIILLFIIFIFVGFLTIYTQTHTYGETIFSADETNISNFKNISGEKFTRQINLYEHIENKIYSRSQGTLDNQSKKELSLNIIKYFIFVLITYVVIYLILYAFLSVINKRKKFLKPTKWKVIISIIAGIPFGICLFLISIGDKLLYFIENIFENYLFTLRLTESFLFGGSIPNTNGYIVLGILGVIIIYLSYSLIAYKIKKQNSPE